MDECDEILLFAQLVRQELSRKSRRILRPFVLMLTKTYFLAANAKFIIFTVKDKHLTPGITRPDVTARATSLAHVGTAGRGRVHAVVRSQIPTAFDRR